ncbi:hypothetical protein K2173_005842 [Erythroxylum novogranatense]|uniref:Uncharacterized protein n=1 Tax=Erythroxylum novogranatense TaxID=1862640 RepID=A0AAV8U449_9ROSI|nr:hypothetical protein K2173_005842 [Erythroxylum novogranatense]
MGIADLTASVFKKKWRSSETIRLGRSDSQGAKMIDRKAVKPRWQVFWRKINREKKKIFTAPTTTTTNFHASYEPDDYFQNFDPGTGWTEPDNLPRSFSARFADPSRILQKSATVGHGKGNFL